MTNTMGKNKDHSTYDLFALSSTNTLLSKVAQVECIKERLSIRQCFVFLMQHVLFGCEMCFHSMLLDLNVF